MPPSALAMPPPKGISSLFPCTFMFDPSEQVLHPVVDQQSVAQDVDCGIKNGAVALRRALAIAVTA